jgi:integrase
LEAWEASLSNLGEEHGHRVLRVRGKSGKVVLVPLPPAVARAIDQPVDGREGGPILRNTLGARMDRHAATRRLKRLAETAGIRMPKMHPDMLRHTSVATMASRTSLPTRDFAEERTGESSRKPRFDRPTTQLPLAPTDARRISFVRANWTFAGP